MQEIERTPGYPAESRVHGKQVKKADHIPYVAFFLGPDLAPCLVAGRTTNSEPSGQLKRLDESLKQDVIGNIIYEISEPNGWFCVPVISVEAVVNRLKGLGIHVMDEQEFREQIYDGDIPNAGRHFSIGRFLADSLPKPAPVRPSRRR